MWYDIKTMDNLTLEKMLDRVQKPGRYTGGERNAVIKDKNSVKLRFAFCFPDVYEVGMSHLGMRILYSQANEEKDIWCERVFAPWFDMREQLAKNSQPLFALESKDPLSDFGLIGFTLQYELSYTNVLYMLDAGGVALRAEERGENDPIVVAGGPCVCNAEPMCDFFDCFLVGEGEYLNPEFYHALIDGREKKLPRKQLLRRLAEIDGVYVPSLYEIEYKEDGTVRSISSAANAPLPVKKRLVPDMDKVYFPEKFVVPLIEIVHDRAVTEVLRGCIRGCRFCQSGYIYRPFRQRSAQVIDRQARSLCDSCGYEEVSLTSLSTSDHGELEQLLDRLLEWTPQRRINLSLPSLRIDNFSEELIEKTTRVRKSGLTFAPEAGTQRLRDVINKNITEAEIFKGCSVAFSNGYSAVKLYFMMGHPTETDEDITAIIKLAEDIVSLFYHTENRSKQKPVNVSVSVACFVPKPHTPFEFCAQDTVAEFRRKQRLLIDATHNRKISLHWHDAETSFVEAVLARGDRRLGAAIENAYRDGAIFDGWADGFSYERWLNAFAKTGLDPAFYANRARSFDEINPWETVDYGVDKSYLEKEYEKATREQTTHSCTQGCAGCGITKLTGRRCFEKSQD